MDIVDSETIRVAPKGYKMFDRCNKMLLLRWTLLSSVAKNWYKFESVDFTNVTGVYKLIAKQIAIDLI
jgi:hypothetical protein